MRWFTILRRSAVVAGLAVAASALVACGSEDDPGAQALKGAVRTPALEVASVALPDVERDGKAVPMKPDPGELYLVYFGYASCPDICPTTLSDIRIALEALPPELAERVTVAMVTVDPDRDTDEVLAGYLAHFFDRRLALRTTDPDELQEAALAFGVQWEVEEHEPGEQYEVAHTAITYVVDDSGTVVVEWPFGFESEAMTDDLTTLLGEERT